MKAEAQGLRLELGCGAPSLGSLARAGVGPWNEGMREADSEGDRAPSLGSVRGRAVTIAGRG